MHEMPSGLRVFKVVHSYSGIEEVKIRRVNEVIPDLRGELLSKVYLTPPMLSRREANFPFPIT